MMQASDDSRRENADVCPSAIRNLNLLLVPPVFTSPASGRAGAAQSRLSSCDTPSRLSMPSLQGMTEHRPAGQSVSIGSVSSLAHSPIEPS